MNKKAIMYEFLVRMIIALVMIVAAIAIGRSFFRISNQGTNSFNEFVGILQNIEDGSQESMTLAMDKGTAIIGFGQGATQVIRANYPGTGNQYPPTLKTCATNQECHSFVNRPPSCPIDIACVCICKDYIENKFKVGCEDTTCQEIRGRNFSESISEEKLHVESVKFSSTIYNGFVFERRKTSDKGYRDEPYGLLSQPKGPPRLRGVYIQRKGDIVSACFNPPCI